MGSCISAIDDELDREQWNEDKDYIKELGNKILNIKPQSSEFEEIKFLFSNKDKIIRNKKLIKLLG